MWQCPRKGIVALRSSRLAACQQHCQRRCLHGAYQIGTHGNGRKGKREKDIEMTHAQIVGQ
ncbi:hypothetical protein GCM10022212_02370 [Actimicrobium antarcticum]|uniref:Uncharacterized protein n=1 Tax=Actimicrobium antarcticum TaxID=1051899 RepID=A0ABP7SIS7_9BURK